MSAQAETTHRGHYLSDDVRSDTERSLRVALLSFDFPQYCIRLANGLAEHAHVLLLAPKDGIKPHRHALDHTAELYQIDTPRLRQPVAQTRMVRRVLARLDQFRPDVIHYQGGHLWFNLVWPFLRRYPVVVSIHETRHHAGDKDSSRTPQWVMDLGYRRADRVIVHGEQLRTAVIADLHRPDEIIDTVPAVPDIVLGSADPGGPVEGDGRTIMFFGRIWPYKGLEYLIRAEPLITERVPDARILIAGRGENLARYRAMMTHPDRFEIDNEYVPDDRVIEYFKRAAVVVLPYVDASISGVIPISCTFGKPIVATAVGILPEMIKHGQSGLIVPPADPRALADAIVEILTNHRRRWALAVGARQRSETVFAPTTVAEQTISVYRRAISGRQ